MQLGFASPNSTVHQDYLDDSKAAVQLLPSKPVKIDYVEEGMWDDAVLAKPPAEQPSVQYQAAEPTKLERIDEEPEKKSDAPANGDDEIYF